MCGVLGLVHSKEDVVTDSSSNSIIAKGLESISLRGPDAEGVSKCSLSNFTITLAHTRLSILDLSELGSQPMSFENLEVTYNGEIYNFVEIREELKLQNYIFLGNSDTEVLLKAWHKWGPACLQKFNGMFAFCLLDKTKEELWLVRDRFGVKPLFYGHENYEKFLFCSSASFLGEYFKSSIESDYCARANRYKVFETEDSESPFSNVKSVKPGTSIRVDLRQNKIKFEEVPWYDLSHAVSQKTKEISLMEPYEMYEECMRLLSESINIRLRSDVPLAVSLSGGLDSSSIAALTSLDTKDLEGFTFGSPEDSATEGPKVKEFTNYSNIECNYIWPQHNKDDLKSLLSNVLKAQEAPFGGLSVIAQHEVYRKVKEKGFSVLLGGQGGDEIFAGYRKFFLVALRNALLEKKFEDSIGFFYSFLRVLFSEISFFGNYLTALKRYTKVQNKNFLLNFTADNLNLWGDKEDNLSKRQIDDVTKFSIPTLLRFEDRNSMSHSVESRLPFMDYRLVEFGISLPANYKIKKGYGKWILREITKNHVPNTIRMERKKRGFDVTKNWVKEGIGEALREVIIPNKTDLEQYLLPQIDLEKTLTNNNLENNKLILDEALMLAWLTDPYNRN